MNRSISPLALMGSPAPVRSSISVNYDGPIATITLDQQSRLNALNGQDFDALADALVAIDRRDDIVVTGKRRAFVSSLFVLLTLSFIKFYRPMENSLALAHKWTVAVKRRGSSIRARKAIVARWSTQTPK